MKFNKEKFKMLSRPMNDSERAEIEERRENRDWLAMSAKFALLIRQALRRDMISQSELAKRMGVSDSQVSKILSGKENLGLQTICKIEKALGRNLIRFDEGVDSNEYARITMPASHKIPVPIYDKNVWCHT